MSNHHTESSPVFIVDGARTPFLKAQARPGAFSAGDLAVSAGRSVLLRQPFLPTELDEVILGCVMPSASEANIARVVALRLGCGDAVPAFTVQRNCASGMQALASAAEHIAMGRSHLVLAGGTEAMSRAPILLSPAMVDWLAKWRTQKSLAARLRLLTQWRLGFLKPVAALLQGLTDPTVGLNMGQTAEILTYQFKITREQMDHYALQSHQRAMAAQQAGHLSEITPLYDSHNGTVIAQDTGVRVDSTLAALSKLKPVFDKPFGSVTAGNSSQVSDGAAVLLLASAQAVARYRLPVLGRLVDTHWVGLDPSRMGLGPVFAVPPLLERHGLKSQDIDYWEINEAFAAQVLSCLTAWQDLDFCQRYLKRNEIFAKIAPEQLNIDGGAIAMGHPVGASGARIVLHTLEVLRRRGASLGVATLCVGGGQGGAMLLERTGETSR